MVPAVVAVVGRNNHRRQKPRPRQRLRWLRWLRWMVAPFFLKPRGRKWKKKAEAVLRITRKGLALLSQLSQKEEEKEDGGK